MDTTLTGCESKSGHTGPLSIIYSFKGQSAPEIDTKFAVKMSSKLYQNANFEIFEHFLFLHFNVDHRKLIAVFGQNTAPENTAKNCIAQCIHCLVKSAGFLISRLICMGKSCCFLVLNHLCLINLIN